MDSNLIVLTDQDGNSVRFELLDIVEYKEDEYAVLYPADGGDDELGPYVYDGSMALADHEKMQQAREALDRLADALREIAAKLVEAMKPVINAVLSALKKLWKVSVRAIGVPPKWLHLAAHAKKARTRKKYRNRIRRYVFEALAAEGGGGP